MLKRVKEIEIIKRIDAWWWWNKSKIAPIIILALLAIVVTVAATVAAISDCRAKTARMGFDHDWHWLGGCVIEVEPDRWIPLENYFFTEEE